MYYSKFFMFCQGAKGLGDDIDEFGLLDDNDFFRGGNEFFDVFISEGEGL